MFGPAGLLLLFFVLSQINFKKVWVSFSNCFGRTLNKVTIPYMKNVIDDIGKYQVKCTHASDNRIFVIYIKIENRC